MIRADACDPALARDVRRRLVLQNEADWRDIRVIVITSLDLDAKDRERLNAGVQFVLLKERFRPADLVERIRRLVHSKPPVLSGMEAAS
jgi:CheY-like chemotaxis protein